MELTDYQLFFTRFLSIAVLYKKKWNFIGGQSGPTIKIRLRHVFEISEACC